MNESAVYLKGGGGDTRLENLLREVQAKSLHPQDYYEIAALLESLGWNDERAAGAFGVEDIFELAILLWNMIRDKVQVESLGGEERLPLYKRAATVIQSFIRGIIFALPMAISVAAMLTLRLSLWSYEYLSTALATSIAIGTILSFMTVGGFTQAIARRGFFYLSQGFYNMAKRITFYLVRIGYVACVVVAVFYFLFNAFYENFPLNLLFVTVLYFVFLCSNWLSITIMYILRKEFQFAALITAGIAVVAVLFYIVRLNIIESQIIALFLVSSTGLVLVVHYFNAAEKKEERGISPPMPKRSIMLYSLGHYFLYGFEYFTFIFIDRIMAWSANNDFSMPYFIWFRGEYELGLDFALLMLIIPMGLAEIIVTSLMKRLEATLKYSFGREVDSLNKKYIGYYIRSTVLVSLGSVLSALLVMLLVAVLQSGRFETLSKVYYFSHTTSFVFYCALVGYALVSVSLSNAVILFSLSQPKMATKALSISLAVNFAVGFAFSRWFDYYYAVFGLIAGSVVFLILSTKYVLGLIGNLNYYIYAAL